ncbi:MAG: response regulator [Melioribacteraceae bacterium]
MQSANKILVVEDELAHFELIERGFEKRKDEFLLRRAVNLEEALVAISEFKPNLIISDWKLPDGNGTDLIIKDSHNNLKIPIILMTSYGYETFAVEAMKLGVLDYIVKSPDIFFDMAHIAERTLREWDNIVEKRNIEDRLRKLSTAVEQSKVINVITDTHGLIEYVNPIFETITGYKSNEAIGVTPGILKSGKTERAVYDDLWQTITAGYEWKGELLNKRKNGELYWESASISPIMDETGRITNFLKVSEDINEKKKMEMELKHALEKAEESNRLKSSILSNMNHEFRTPLMGILGMTELLIEEIEDEGHEQMLERVKASGKRLMTTLNSILDLSELESDRTFFKLSEYSIDDFLIPFLKKFNKTSEERNLPFSYEIKNRDLALLVYERFFEQVLTNIIENSFKYTNSGYIKVIIESVDLDSKLWAKISIEDTGIGIAPENFGLIFEEFRQASEGMSRNYEGSGLGLTIAKKMIEVMKGTISVVSKVNLGSTFTILLPAMRIARPSKQEEKDKWNTTINDIRKKVFVPSGGKPLILFVEDNKLNQEVTKLFLKDLALVDCVSDGRSAINIVNEKLYSLILMDINLGAGIDGIEATRQIRQIRGYENIPIIAVTGYASSADREKFIAFGLTDILVKPFNKDEILDLVKQILKPEQKKQTK